MRKLALAVIIISMAASAGKPPDGWPGLLDYWPAFYYTDQWDYDSALQKALNVAATTCPENCAWQMTKPEYQFNCRWGFGVSYTRLYYDKFGNVIDARPCGSCGFVIQYVKHKKTQEVGWIVMGGNYLWY